MKMALPLDPNDEHPWYCHCDGCNEDKAIWSKLPMGRRLDLMNKCETLNLKLAQRRSPISFMVRKLSLSFLQLVESDTLWGKK